MAKLQGVADRNLLYLGYNQPNLVFLRGFSDHSFASLINRARRRARARMARLGLLHSRGPGIVQDRSA